MKIAVAGCTGRMGLTLVKAVMEQQGCILTAGSERPDYDEHTARAKLTALECGEIALTSLPEELANAADAVIDFTAPEATLAVARAVAARGGILIVGTTGFSAAQQQELNVYAAKARIVQSGNFSLGINLLALLVEQASKLLHDDYDIEISELHHKHKKDAPSGTALMLGRAAAKGRNLTLEHSKVTSRDGITGERKRGDIGFAVQRGGDVVGLHSVLFAGPGEVIELKHQGFSREIYAHGALRAALWAKNQPPGLYSMRDVLGL